MQPLLWLQSHSLVSIDFFAVPTITMRVLFVFVVLEHRRRQVLHFNVTEHPTGLPQRRRFTLDRCAQNFRKRSRCHRTTCA
jgi:hypothetical protein